MQSSANHRPARCSSRTRCPQNTPVLRVLGWEPQPRLFADGGEGSAFRCGCGLLLLLHRLKCYRRHCIGIHGKHQELAVPAVESRDAHRVVEHIPLPEIEKTTLSPCSYGQICRNACISSPASVRRILLQEEKGPYPSSQPLNKIRPAGTDLASGARAQLY